MKIPRGIVGIYAMARPSRPLGERDAVRAAAWSLARERSVQAIAGDIARRVVADAMAYVYLDLSDPMIAALDALESRFDPSPIRQLARCPEIDTASEILDRRAELYRSRGCRQLGPVEWEAETRAVCAHVEKKLAKRYARHLRK